MSGQDEGRALTILWVVAILASLAYGGVMLIALVEEPPVALFGFLGLLVGALLASCTHLTWRRRPELPQAAPTGDRLGDSLEARLEMLEQERMRMAELEERLDFAERLLAGGRFEPDPEVRTP